MFIKEHINKHTENGLTACSGLILEKLTVVQLLPKFLILWNKTVHYRVHNNLPVTCMLNRKKTQFTN
jgi:hypothetical protein